MCSYGQRWGTCGWGGGEGCPWETGPLVEQEAAVPAAATSPVIVALGFSACGRRRKTSRGPTRHNEKKRNKRKDKARTGAV